MPGRQEHKLIQHKVQLQMMLDGYHGAVASLANADLLLMESHISRLKSLLKPPCHRINWYSLVIKDFISKFMSHLNIFNGVVKSIERTSMDIRGILYQAENLHMFKMRPPLYEGHYYSCKEVFNFAYAQRDMDIDQMVKQVSSIGILITKIKTTIAGSHSTEGHPPNFGRYCSYWEKNIFRSITALVIKNIKWFIFKLKQDTPFFSVEALLAPPDVILTPQSNDIYNTVMSSARDIVGKTKKFIRWLRGTCTEAPPQKVKFQDEPYIFSYYNDIVNNQEVIDLVTECEEVIVKAVVNVHKYMSTWKRYRQLWRGDKEEQLDKWLLKPRSATDFDYRFQFYVKSIEDIQKREVEKDIGCIHLSTEQLAEATAKHARDWIRLLGKRLHAQAYNKLISIYEEINDKSSDLEDTTDNLDELKSVLTTIQSIKDNLLTWETRWRAVQEEYRTLRMYDVEVSDDELQQQAEVPHFYESVLLKAKNRDCRLVVVKAKFKMITEHHVNNFKEECEKFFTRFKEQGPGSVGENLQLGDSLMQAFSQEADELEEKRLELSKAEKLFELPITVHERLLDVKKQIAGLQQVYALYRELDSAKNKWSETLWADLDIDLLSKGIDDFIKNLRKLPKSVRSLTPAISLDQVMKQFKESLPLIVDLKSEALRERHWKELMTKTDQYFDMNPKTFTLAGIFSMKLYRFSNLITEIVVAATKEMSIEKVRPVSGDVQLKVRSVSGDVQLKVRPVSGDVQLKGISEVEETWKKAKFVILPYIKANRKSHVLGPIDDILQNLDDCSVNLQSMSASRFIGPFLPLVQSWEKALSKMSEVIDVWLQVQRKWMYLEGIFGGGDISKQLPEQAKFFDKIDKQFKKIMDATNDNPNIKHATHVEGRYDEMLSLSLGLEKCQKSLNDYLDSKRNAFPRFFFISDDELLSILGSSDPECVQEHIIKMYDNIASLRFVKSPINQKDLVVTAMISAEKEVMEFRAHINTSDRVESWMTSVLNEMRCTNRLITKEAVYYYSYQKSRYRGRRTP
ncbi:Dynein heavy chain 10, axonemal [Bulinus truncatus]|nr:Dynein heavy chain 10, axonemal [Bulinus truncatus]